MCTCPHSVALETICPVDRCEEEGGGEAAVISMVCVCVCARARVRESVSQCLCVRARARVRVCACVHVCVGWVVGRLGNVPFTSVSFPCHNDISVSTTVLALFHSP